MRKLLSLCFLLLIPVLTGLALVPGCDNGVPPRGKPRHLLTGTGEEAEVPRIAVADTAHGTITGRVLYDGDPPTPRPLSRAANESACHAEPPYQMENYDEDWLVDKDTKGVQNVVIFLQPLPGKFFKLTPEQEKSKGDLVIDQPLCGFRPRVFVLFPSFYDVGTHSQKPTGQKLIIRNSAPFSHNYNMKTFNDENRDSGGTLTRGQESIIDYLQPQAKPVIFKCDIHSWMRAYGFVLEHPYWAITKEDGSFKLENVPLDTPLQVVGWHEAAGFFNGGEEGSTEILKANQSKTFTIKGRS